MATSEESESESVRSQQGESESESEQHHLDPKVWQGSGVEVGSGVTRSRGNEPGVAAGVGRVPGVGVGVETATTTTLQQWLKGSTAGLDAGLYCECWA